MEFEQGKKTFDNYMDLKFYLEEVRFSWDRHPFASRYALYSDNRSGVLDTNIAIVEVDSSVLSYSGIFADGYYRRETDSLWRVAKIYGDTINLDTT